MVNPFLTRERKRRTSEAPSPTTMLRSMVFTLHLTLKSVIMATATAMVVQNVVTSLATLSLSSKLTQMATIPTILTFSLPRTVILILINALTAATPPMLAAQEPQASAVNHTSALKKLQPRLSTLQPAPPTHPIALVSPIPTLNQDLIPHQMSPLIPRLTVPPSLRISAPTSSCSQTPAPKSTDGWSSMRQPLAISRTLSELRVPSRTSNREQMLSTACTTFRSELMVTCPEIADHSELSMLMPTSLVNR